MYIIYVEIESKVKLYDLTSLMFTHVDVYTLGYDVMVGLS